MDICTSLSIPIIGFNCLNMCYFSIIITKNR